MATFEQEAKWAEDIERTRNEFEARVWAVMALGRSKAKRKQHYKKLREEIGDDAAREVAKMVEGIHAGTQHYPRWFKRTT